MQIYLTFIRPILEYASPVWGGLPKHLSDSLESIQKRCLRIIGLPADALPTLASRHERATQRRLENILKDNTSPLWGFITTPSANHYNLRRGGRHQSMINKSKRHSISTTSEVSQHMHIEAPGHSVSLVKLKILDSEPDFLARGVKEVVYIRANRPTLNRDGERHRLSDTCDPLLQSRVSGVTSRKLQ
ncbi:hypothetical protein Bbelb_052250 [Branchiostoma belcheri]|nr:hypothetical protein Bbelb_052250 [Branchiostoma belcheri]